ncbi:MAG: mechanosensitive ion channel [Planctomycetaceae bacterium]|nr:mechanosensitive ion channel [Planctomycetaceae bacterium]
MKDTDQAPILPNWFAPAHWALDGEFVFAALLTSLLVVVLPRHERRQSVQSIVLLALGALGWLLVRLSHGSEFDRALTLGSTLFLLLCIGRTAFLLAVTLAQRVLKLTFQTIYLDVILCGIYVAALLTTLSLAGVRAGELFAGSAIVTAIIGLSLKDTLGNLFAGLAIQVHQPFDVDDWIQFNDRRDHIGKVREINWRATTVVTLDAVEVVIPNSKLAEMPVTVFTRPKPWSRRSIFFVCPYGVPPARVQAIVLEAVRGAWGVAEDPPPSVVSNAFNERGVEYWLRFFTSEFDRRDRVDGGVRDRVWYGLARHGIVMPTSPHSVELRPIEHDEDAGDLFELPPPEAVLRRVSLFSELPDDALAILAHGARLQRYLPDEVIIQQGSEGSELYVIESGRVAVFAGGVGDAERLLSHLGPGDFFGEMSLLVGEPRRATVRAVTECELLVVNKPAMAAVFERTPELAARVSEIVAQRRAGLAAHHASLQVAEEPPTASNLLARIRKYFGAE